MVEMLEHLFGFVCGQNPGHTWSPGGVLLPCCQRCLGLYAGAAIATALHWRLRPSPTGRFLAVHGALLALMAPFGFHWLPQGAVLRTLSGIWFGAGAVTLLLAPWTGAASSSVPKRVAECGRPRPRQAPGWAGRFGFFAAPGTVHAAAPEGAAPCAYPRASERPLGVTRTSGLPYRRPAACLPRVRMSAPIHFPPRGCVGRHADWKSAIRQTGGLRYAEGLLAPRHFRVGSSEGALSPGLMRPWPRRRADGLFYSLLLPRRRGAGDGCGCYGLGLVAALFCLPMLAAWGGRPVAYLLSLLAFGGFSVLAGLVLANMLLGLAGIGRAARRGLASLRPKPSPLIEP